MAWKGVARRARRRAPRRRGPLSDRPVLPQRNGHGRCKTPGHDRGLSGLVADYPCPLFASFLATAVALLLIATKNDAERPDPLRNILGCRHLYNSLFSGFAGASLCALGTKGLNPGAKPSLFSGITKQQKPCFRQEG